MVAAVAGGVPVKGAPFLPTMQLSPGVRTPREQVHHDILPPSKAVVSPLSRPRQHPAALASAQCYSTVHHLPAVHCGKRISDPIQSYGRGGGLAAAAQMSHRTPRYHRRRVRTAAVDPRWYRSRCCYRCTAAGTTGYHSRCRRCDRCMTGATLLYRSRCRRGRYALSAVGRKGLGSEYMRSRWRREWQLRCPSSLQVPQSLLNLRGSRAADIFASCPARPHRSHQIPEAGPP